MATGGVAHRGHRQCRGLTAGQGMRTFLEMAAVCFEPGRFPDRGVATRGGADHCYGVSVSGPCDPLGSARWRSSLALTQPRLRWTAGPGTIRCDLQIHLERGVQPSLGSEVRSSPPSVEELFYSWPGVGMGEGSQTHRVSDPCLGEPMWPRF